MTEKETSILNDEQDIIKGQRFQEQCFLLDFYKHFVPKNTEPGNNKTPKKYKHFVQLNGAPGTIMNKLLARGIAGFMQIKPEHLSLLQPRLRFYKSVFGRNGKVGDVELYFDDYYDENKLKQITKNRGQRGAGVALKSFTWEDMGSTPGDTGKQFAATLHLHAQSIDDIFHEQVGDNGLVVSFADLLRAPPTKYLPNRPNIHNEKFFRLKVQIGWQVPPNARNLFGEELFTAIKNTFITMFINLHKHTIDMKENKTVDLKIEYIGAIESKLYSPEADVLYVGKYVDDQIQNQNRLIKDDQKRKIELRDKLAKEGSKIGIIDTPGFGQDLERRIRTNIFQQEFSQTQLDYEYLQQSIEQRIKKKENLVRENRGKAYKRLLTKLELEDRIFYTDIPNEKLNLLGETLDEEQLTNDAAARLRAERIKEQRENKEEVKFDVGSYKKSSEFNDEFKKSIDDSVKAKDADARKEIFDAMEEKLSRANSKKKNNMTRINFVYFGDIVDAALSVVFRPENEEQEKKDEFRFLLGPLEFLDPLTGKREQIALADVPISLNLFQAWFLKSVVRPQLKKLPLRDFLRKICSELVVRALSPACFGETVKGVRNRISFATFSLPGDNKELARGKGRVDIDGIKTINLRKGSVEKLKNYFMLYVAGYAPENLNGTYKDDIDRGIYHFLVGADRGLAKRFVFDRVNMQYLPEARITAENENYKGDLFLSEPYNAKVFMWGNAIFKPGMMVYIDPTSVGMGKDVPKSKRLPLGGYYSVSKVENIAKIGQYETILNLNWEADASLLKPTPKPAQKVIPGDGSGLGGLPKIDEPLGPIAKKARGL